MTFKNYIFIIFEHLSPCLNNDNIFDLYCKGFYRLFKPADRRHVKPSDDGHQRIEVADVETLPRCLDPKFDGFHPLLFFRML